ncbi:ATP-binding protein [Verticiella sediminum]|uniref:ATP-binding protein n=1 Tax=Verticiella sediminum TaxID=1247510 RepID=A0A556A5U9_9BURK|nr:YncE family protein [Verticiella sediminum]TSH88259.1 ATP-binding protein [Verticiella sediminum]
MNPIQSSRPTVRFGACRRAAFALAALTLSVGSAYAAAFDQAPAKDFGGRVMASGLVVPGEEATITGRGFQPGQRVTLSYGGEKLNDSPYVVDDKGGFEAKVAVPKSAAAARYGIAVEVANPPAATTFDLKVSPVVPLSGADRYTVQSEKLVPGVYQSDYSAKTGKLFATSAVGRPPVTQSQLVKIDPQTLKVEAAITPAQVPGRDDNRVYAVYGVGVDDENGNVWVTNTRDSTVAVYSQADLSLVKQFDADAVPHSRDVVVVPGVHKAYVSSPMQDEISVFDTAKLAALPGIEVKSGKRGEKFGPMSLALDAQNGKLYTVAMNTAEIAVIDVKTDTLEKVIPVPGAVSGAGIAVDPKSQRAFVAAQGTDNVVVVDLSDGRVLADTPVGAGALNVTFDPVKNLVYAANRGAGTVTVLDTDGKIVANLDGGTFPNHVSVDGKGNAYLLNKSRGSDDPKGDRISRITAK